MGVGRVPGRRGAEELPTPNLIFADGSRACDPTSRAPISVRYYWRGCPPVGTPRSPDCLFDSELSRGVSRRARFEVRHCSCSVREREMNKRGCPRVGTPFSSLHIQCGLFNSAFLRVNQGDRSSELPFKTFDHPSPVNLTVAHVNLVNLVNLTFHRLQLPRWRGANYPRSVQVPEGPMKGAVGPLLGS